MTRLRKAMAMVGGLIAVTICLAIGVLHSVNGQSSTVTADQPTKGADRQTDRDAIKAMLGQFRDAIQKGDAAAAVTFMTTEAEMIPEDGDPLKGREAIQKAYTAHFAVVKKGKFKIEPESLRFTSRDTAIEEGKLTVTREDESPESHLYHILYVREDGKWLISVIKETAVETTDLEDLSWLIGTWSAKQGDGEVQNTYEWMGNQSFIKATISVRGKERSFTAMQIIGLDPTTGVIRTWTFENDGGLGEGTIIRDGHRWIFENVTTLTGGAVLETSNILLPVDRNTITWQPIDLTINGEPIGNLPPTKLTRVKK